MNGRGLDIDRCDSNFLSTILPILGTTPITPVDFTISRLPAYSTASRRKPYTPDTTRWRSVAVLMWSVANFSSGKTIHLLWYVGHIIILKTPQ